MKCPKCDSEIEAYVNNSPLGICAVCGIAMNKWIEIQIRKEKEEEYLATLSNEEKKQRIVNKRNASSRLSGSQNLPKALINYLLFVPANTDQIILFGKALVYIVFVFWGAAFIMNGVDWTTIGSSFLHNANLPFHEFGHVLFSFFEDFWMLLGGSLFQIVLPLIIGLVFMIKQRENFSASICLWWCGQNFIDVSPYILDAPTRYLPLTSNHPDAHDWWNLLNMTNTMDNAAFFANLSFMLGVAIILLSNVWGGFLLMKENKSRFYEG